MSSATPAAFVSAMSTTTTSASSLCAIARATVAPTFPAPPTTVTFRFIIHSVRSDSLCQARRDPQFLWKTLWKCADERRVTLVFRNKSADCTIHGALHRRQAKYYMRSYLCELLSPTI